MSFLPHKDQYVIEQELKTAIESHSSFGEEKFAKGIAQVMFIQRQEIESALNDLEWDMQQKVDAIMNRPIFTADDLKTKAATDLKAAEDMYKSARESFESMAKEAIEDFREKMTKEFTARITRAEKEITEKFMDELKAL